VILSGWVGAGLDGKCGILFAVCWGVVVYAGLVSLTSSYPSPYSPYSSELFVLDRVGLPPGFCYVCVCIGLARLGFFCDTQCSKN